MAGNCTGAAFAQFLIDQQPHYDREILRTIKPNDGWIGHVSTGSWEAGVGSTLYQDRLENTYPDVTQQWSSPSGGTNCVGTPCDPTENLIGYGATRRNYSVETQSWATQLFCYDQMLPISHAKETFSQIIGNILRPATNTIQSTFLKKRALLWADKKWVTNAAMDEFSYTWLTVGTSEAYLLTNKIPSSKLTPQMLQRRYQPLVARGYFGQNPYEGQKMLPLVELVTDMDTCWELDHMGGQSGTGGGSPTIASNWRFQQWDAASEFWRYGLSGQIGNYAARVDPEQLRFNYVGASGNATYPYKFQVVLPFRNVASSGAGGAAGIKAEANPYYFTAQYRLSFIWHKKAMQVLTQQNTTINSEMPFMRRDFGGKWQFVMDNLTCGTDGSGNPIAVDNSRRNKGKFIADFRLAIRPLYTEYAEAIFHKAEPLCVYEVGTCSTESYATQTYTSSNSSC